MGAEDFAEWLSGKLVRRGRRNERARERRETDEQIAERFVREGLKVAGWTERNLRESRKAYRVKDCLGREIRTQTPMTRAWIAKRLYMGSPSYLSALLSVNSKN